MSIEKSRLDYIDTLRGVAILLVIIVHTSQVERNLPIEFLKIGSYGQMGVLLFFVLSALTLSISFDKVTFSVQNIVSFYFRRYFRIAPLYYIGILIYLIFFSILISQNVYEIKIAPQYTLSSIFSNIFFIHGFVPEGNNNVVPGGWSIGTEMAFYLLFPLIFRVLNVPNNYFRNVIVLMIIFLCFVSVLFLGLKFENQNYNNTFLYYNLINMLPVFVLSISYFLYLKYNSEIVLIKSKYLSFFLMSITFIISAVIYNFYFSVFFSPLICTIAFILLIDVFKHFDVLNHKYLVKVGQLSFSIYIFHFIFAWFAGPKMISFINPNLTPSVNFIINISITIVCSILVALISEKYIEKVGINFGKKVYQKIKL